MRLPRRRFLIPLLLVIAGGIFFEFNVFWHINGWLRGDAYFKGMPTCYWANSLNEGYGTPAWQKKLLGYLGFPSTHLALCGNIYCKDPKVAPVLLQLATNSSNSPKVRSTGVACLIGDHFDHSGTEVTKVCLDIFADDREETELRTMAAVHVMGVAHKGKVSKIEVSAFLEDTNPRIRVLAAGMMWAQAEEIAVVGHFLVDVIENDVVGGIRLRHDASCYLQWFPPLEAAPFLLRMSHHEERWARLTASTGMWNLCQKLAMNHEIRRNCEARLKFLLDDQDPVVREVAGIHLQSLEGK